MLRPLNRENSRRPQCPLPTIELFERSNLDLPRSPVWLTGFIREAVLKGSCSLILPINAEGWKAAVPPSVAHWLHLRGPRNQAGKGPRSGGTQPNRSGRQSRVFLFGVLRPTPMNIGYTVDLFAGEKLCRSRRDLSPQESQKTHREAQHDGERNRALQSHCSFGGRVRGFRSCPGRAESFVRWQPQTERFLN